MAFLTCLEEHSSQMDGPVWGLSRTSRRWWHSCQSGSHTPALPASSQLWALWANVRESSSWGNSHGLVIIWIFALEALCCKSFTKLNTTFHYFDFLSWVKWICPSTLIYLFIYLFCFTWTKQLAGPKTEFRLGNMTENCSLCHLSHNFISLFGFEWLRENFRCGWMFSPRLWARQALLSTSHLGKPRSE